MWRRPAPTVRTTAAGPVLDVDLNTGLGTGKWIATEAGPKITVASGFAVSVAG